MRNAQDVNVLDPSSKVRRPLLFAVLVAVGVAIADQVTKRWALSALNFGSCSVPENCIELFAGVRFNLVFNTGAAFTAGSGLGPLLGVLAFFMTGFLLYLASKRSDRLGVALYGIIAGGAAGNLIDRIFRAEDGPLSGAVVDFVDVGWWPVFNVADAAIVVGVIAVILLTLIEGDGSESAGEEVAPSDSRDLDETDSSNDESISSPNDRVE